MINETNANENKFKAFFKKGFWAMLWTLFLAALGFTIFVKIAKWAWDTDLVKGWREEINEKFSGLRKTLEGYLGEIRNLKK